MKLITPVHKFKWYIHFGILVKKLTLALPQFWSATISLSDTQNIFSEILVARNDQQIRKEKHSTAAFVDYLHLNETMNYPDDTYSDMTNACSLIAFIASINVILLVNVWPW